MGALKFYCASCGRMINGSHTRIDKMVYHYSCAPVTDDSAAIVTGHSAFHEFTSRVVREIAAVTATVNSPPFVKVSGPKLRVIK